jgi:hypothetical protein
MGWASASGIFDTVADALIEANASYNVAFTACSKLIGELQSNDWDTEDESLERYTRMPGSAVRSAIVQAFADHGVYNAYCGETGSKESPNGRTIILRCIEVSGHPGLHVCTIHGSWS